MIPSLDMRRRLAYMNAKNPDGTLRARDHLLRVPLVVDLDNEAEVARIFNSGGAGLFAKPQEYCSEWYPNNLPAGGHELTNYYCRGSSSPVERWNVSNHRQQIAAQGNCRRNVFQPDFPVPQLQPPEHIC